MPLFKYIAINEANKKIKGIISAGYLHEAKQKLAQKNYVLTDIDLLKSKVIAKNISSKEVLQFTRELAKLLSASLPLYDALVSLEEKYRNKKIHPMLLSLCEKIKGGSSFSSALDDFPLVFDILYRAMIANSEKTGSLSNAFNELTQILTNQESVKKKVINTLTYPCILTVFCLGVLASLFFFVIPSLADLFDQREVHFFTRMVLAISKWLNEKKALFFLFLTVFSSLIFVSIFTKKFKIFFQYVSLKIPLVGNILVKLALIRFSRSFSALLDGGISFINAFQSAVNVMKHPYLEKCFKEVEAKVLEGASFSSELEKIALIPSFIVRMVSIAEKSGNLAFIFKQIAEIEESDLTKNLTQLTSMVQPVILLFLGLIVGLVLLAVLIPLTDVSSFINF